MHHRYSSEVCIIHTRSPSRNSGIWSDWGQDRCVQQSILKICCNSARCFESILKSETFRKVIIISHVPSGRGTNWWAQKFTPLHSRSSQLSSCDFSALRPLVSRLALSLAAVLAGKNASGISNEYTGSTANGRCYHTPFCQRMHLGGQYTRSN